MTVVAARDQSPYLGREWVVWEGQVQVWASFLGLCVKAPSCGARREIMAAVGIVSNIQLLWSAGEMKSFDLQ